MSNKILVVDDETEIADLIEVYLKNENYTVFKFYTAQEALNCIETTPIDLAILDIMLPDIDGFTLCKKIREHHTYPIIMLTANIYSPHGTNFQVGYRLFQRGQSRDRVIAGRR